MSDLLDRLLSRFEMYVNEYNRAEKRGDEQIMTDRKYSAYEIARTISLIDSDLYGECVTHLRENNL
jgi:hypothetical protein